MLKLVVHFFVRTKKRHRSFLMNRRMRMFEFYLRSFLLGVGLAMDACAVSMANGLKEPKMKLRKLLFIAGLFAIFQAIMPLIGYFLGHAILEWIDKFIPWIALVILCFLGGNMLISGIRNKEETKDKSLTFFNLLIQAVATSIDALSVGFTIANYKIEEALLCVSIIALVTFIICIAAVCIGKKFGTKLGNKSEILGGIILIVIGLEIFLSGIL